MERRRPRKLNFNAPLLSTRRPSSYLEEQATCSGSQQDRVPFCWEQAPGKPKELGTDEEFTPRPKPPPGRWRAPANNDGDGALPDHLPADDEGCEANFEGDEDDTSDSGKDMDILSLTEAIDLVEKEDRQTDEASDEPYSQSNLDRLTLESAGTPSPNFMMERFLPDATALAAASALSLSKNLNRKLPYLCHYPETKASKSVVESISSPKTCGLGMVLPWRMRQRLAGVKSLVQAKGNAKEHKKRFSSLHITSADWSCK